MPTLVERSDGRFELRESVWTARGPRSRTLATFRELTPEVIDHAVGRATTPVDRESIVERAGQAGLHVKRVLGASEAAALIGRARREGLWPSLAAAIQEVIGELATGPLPDHLEAIVDWLGVGDKERGEALLDLLRVADRIERSRSGPVRGELEYPSLCRLL